MVIKERKKKGGKITGVPLFMRAGGLSLVTRGKILSYGCPQPAKVSMLARQEG